MDSADKRRRWEFTHQGEFELSAIEKCVEIFPSNKPGRYSVIFVGPRDVREAEAWVAAHGGILVATPASAEP